MKKSLSVFSKLFIYVCCILLILIIGACQSDSKNNASATPSVSPTPSPEITSETIAPTDQTTPIPTVEPTPLPTAAPTKAPTAKPSPKPTPTAAPTPTKKPAPTQSPVPTPTPRLILYGHTIDELAETFPFSRDEIITILIAEDYSSSYIYMLMLPTAHVDWNKQAIDRAKLLISVKDYTYSELIQDLELCLFTDSESIYGANNCGIDWNKKALEKVNDYYTETPNLSVEEIENKLKEDGFSYDHYLYVKENLGV